MALEGLEVEPDRAVVIGDWKERDIAGGQAAGLHTVYARYGDQYSKYSDKSAEPEAEPDYVVDDLLQLLDVLDQLNGPVADRRTEMRVCTARADGGHRSRDHRRGVPGEELMERAGQAMTEAAAGFPFRRPAGSRLRRRHADRMRRVLVLCGKGNNGGDGLVVARLLAEGLAVAVLLLAGSGRP